MLVDDHRFLAEVLATRLAALGHEPIVVDLSQSILEQADNCTAGGVVVLDLQLGEDVPSGEEYIAPLVERGCQVLVLSGVTEPHAFARCLELGATGVLEKTTDFESLVASIDACLHGEAVPPTTTERARMARELEEHRRLLAQSRRPFEALSPKEERVLASIMQGDSAAEISAAMFVSLSTVRTQIKSITRKLNVTSQLQAVALAHHVGWSNEAEPEKTKPEPDAAGPIKRTNADNRASRIRR